MKIWIWIVVVVVVLIAAYFLLAGTNSPVEELPTEEAMEESDDLNATADVNEAVNGEEEVEEPVVEEEKAE